MNLLKRKLLVRCDVKSIYEKLIRTKSLSTGAGTRLRRCLNLYHICFLGIGHMVGAGIYIFTGGVIKIVAGPAIILSFIFAGLAALLSALCYAELEAKIPKTGSAYSYSYVAIGEFCAFVIGWDMVLENTLGAATLAKSWSLWLDFLLDYRIKNATAHYIGTITDVAITQNVNSAPDVLAALLIILVTLMICLGARRSANFNSCFALLSLIVMVFIISYGLSFADLNNWTDPALCNVSCKNVTGSGCSKVDAFFPFGFMSIWKGAADIFFSYIGFEAIASAAEEAKNPRRSLPFGTLIAICMVILLYTLMVTTLTLMLPYCKIEEYGAFAKVFLYKKRSWAHIVVSIGALSAMTTVLFAHLFSLPRCIYAMSMDGLFFDVFKKLHPKTQVPIVASIVFGLLATVLALVFNLEMLKELVSIGNLTSYNAVAVSLMLLRYCPDTTSTPSTRNSMTTPCRTGQLKPIFSFLRHIFRCFKPGTTVSWMMLFMIPVTVAMAAVIDFGGWTRDTLWWRVTLIVLLLLVFFFCVFSIYAHFQGEKIRYFHIPFVPLLPAASISLNFILMLHLSNFSWSRFIAWFAVGTIIYFAYSIRHSTENVRKPAQKVYANGSVGGTTRTGEIAHRNCPISTITNDNDAFSSVNNSTPNYIMSRFT